MSASKADMGVEPLYERIEEETVENLAFNLLSASPGELRENVTGVTPSFSNAVRALIKSHEVALVEDESVDAYAEYNGTDAIRYSSDFSESVVTVSLLQEFMHVLQNQRCMNKYSEESLDIEAQAATFIVANYFGIDVRGLALDLQLRDGENLSTLARSEDRIRELSTTVIPELEAAL